MKLFRNPKKTESLLEDINYEIQNSKNESAKKRLTEVGINTVDELGRNALIWACSVENMDMITWLVENNANIDHQDRNGYSALHFIALERNEKAAAYLLSKNAKTELKDCHGNTPLWAAVMNAKDDLSVVELLLKNNANLNNVNIANRTPREIAEKILGLEFQKLIKRLNLE